MPWSCGGHAFGNLWMADSASASSASKPTAAVALRVAYHSAAAAASTTASSRYSRSRATLACRVNAPTGFRPRHGGRRAGIDAIESRPNLCRPSSFSLGVNLVLEALNQFAGQRRTLFVRKAKRLSEKLPRIHGRRLALPPSLASGSG